MTLREAFSEHYDGLFSRKARQAGRRAAASLSRVPWIQARLRKLAKRDQLPTAVWQRLPNPDCIEIFLPDDIQFVWCAGRSAVARSLYWRGRDSDEIATLDPFSVIARLSDVVIDVGANTGLYTLCAAASNTNSTVIAFEPVAETAGRLEANVRGNSLDERVSIRRQAVGSSAGRAKFHVPFGEFPASASLGSVGFRGLAGRLIDVETVALDDVHVSTSRALIKIDVEGSEHVVLDGGRQVLAAKRPALVLECNPDGPVPAIEARLAAYGYQFFWLSPHGPIPMSTIIPDPTERFRNYLALHPADPRGHAFRGGTGTSTTDSSAVR